MKPLPYKNLLPNDKGFKDSFGALDSFEKMRILKQLFLSQTSPLKGAGYSMFRSQVLNLRQMGMLSYEDDLFTDKAGEKEVPLVLYTRNALPNGFPVREDIWFDADNPERGNIPMPQHGVASQNELAMILARKSSLGVLKDEVTARRTGGDGDKKTDYFANQVILRAANEAYITIAPAFDIMSMNHKGPNESPNTLNSKHREFIQKYALAKYLENVNGSNSEDPILSAEQILEDLYFNNHWLVTLPGGAGTKRLIPKNLPFPFAGEIESDEIEYFMKLWYDESNMFKDYVKKKIKDDEGGDNIEVYVDVSKSGEGISYFFRGAGYATGEEDPSTMISWKEFGNWIAMKYKFSMLADAYYFFNEVPYDPDATLHDPRQMLPTFRKSKYQKLIELVHDWETKAVSDPPKARLTRSGIESVFYNEAGFMGFRKRGDLDRLWGRRKLGTFSDEWNYLLSTFVGGNQSEIGYLGREALIDFLKRVNKDTSAEEFNKILNEEMSRYVLDERDLWDAISSNSSDFGEWASERVKALDIRFGEETKMPKKYRKGSYR